MTWFFDMDNEGKLRHVPRCYFLMLLAALAGQILFWQQARDVRVLWSGVSTAPAPEMAMVMGLGDGQLYYRFSGLGLQNLGDWAGAVTPFSQYDYGRLAGWFRLLSQLDPGSHYVPALAAYYYGQSNDPGQLRQIIGYLRGIAVQNPNRHWRWLAYSAYLARYRVKDPVLGLELAKQLAGLQAAGLPVWTRQMPAFVLAEQGDVEAARDILETILATTPDLPQAEQKFMRSYIDDRLGFNPRKP